MDTEARKLRAQLGAHVMWANTLDPASRTAKARSAANGRFEQQARAKYPEATDEQIARVAEHLRKAHFKAMGLKSAMARRAKSARAAA
ncbi:hypothetical protein [Streptomyces griseus]|uniref:hypothetical protein n=1 Tax=Streptomyces griseus TaxID=1911 RepID=UPI00365EE9DD